MHYVFYFIFSLFYFNEPGTTVHIPHMHQQIDSLPGGGGGGKGVVGAFD